MKFDTDEVKRIINRIGEFQNRDPVMQSELPAPLIDVLKHLGLVDFDFTQRPIVRLTVVGELLWKLNMRVDELEARLNAPRPKSYR